MPENAITLQELRGQIKFHKENISIQSAERGCKVSNFSLDLHTQKGLMLDVVEDRYAAKVDWVYFHDEDNSEIIPSSDGVYHLVDTKGNIYAIKFFLAVTNLAETTS